MESDGGGAGAQPPPRQAPVSSSRPVAGEPESMRGGAVDPTPAFRSVKEAAAQFGGSSVAAGDWKPLRHGHVQLSPTDIELMKVEEQIVKLDMDLYVKERQTLNVLKELETTKKIVDGLKLQLQEQEPKHDKVLEVLLDNTTLDQIQHVEHKFPIINWNCSSVYQGADKMYQFPGSILMELNQAKMNLSKTTSGLTGCRTSVQDLKCQISEEKFLLKKTRERIRLNMAKITTLEQDLSKETSKLKITREKRAKRSGNSTDLLSQIRQLEFEKKRYSKMTEDAKSEICELLTEIEQTTLHIKTAEVRGITAKKMEMAAKTAEATALAKVKVLEDGKVSTRTTQGSPKVELFVDKYAKLMHKLEEADETSKRKFESALLELKEEEQSKLELLEKVKEAIDEVETSRKALKAALKREEEANSEKQVAEEALRKSRLEPNKRTWSYDMSSKFKKPSATPAQAASQILDVNGLSLVACKTNCTLRANSLSIGQILSRRWTIPEENKAFPLPKINGNVNQRISLGQMLSMKPEMHSPLRIDDGSTRKKHFSVKKKRFGFFALALLLAKQKKKAQKAV